MAWYRDKCGHTSLSFLELELNERNSFSQIQTQRVCRASMQKKDGESSKLSQTTCRISRETQTKTSRTKYTSTGCDSGTQTETSGKGCKTWLLAKSYTSSTSILQLKHIKARMLQHFWRVAVARRSLLRLRRDFQRSMSVSF